MKKTFVIVLLAALMLSLVGGVFAQDDLSGELEIFSWWAGDEGPAYTAKVKDLRRVWPEATSDDSPDHASTAGS